MTSVAEINKKREELKKAYPGAKWATKVNLMPAEQVIAVYLRLKAQNKI